MDSALAFYDKVVDIWYKFLASMRNEAQAIDGFSEAQLSEVQRIMHAWCGSKAIVLYLQYYLRVQHGMHFFLLCRIRRTRRTMTCTVHPDQIWPFNSV